MVKKNDIPISDETLTVRTNRLSPFANDLEYTQLREHQFLNKPHKCMSFTKYVSLAHR